MEEEEKSFIWQLKDAGAEYLQAKLQLTRAQAFGKISKVTAIIMSFLIIALLACFTILFVGLMLGFLISDFVGSNAIGFSIIGVLFIAMLILMVVKRESMLEKPLNIRIIKELFEDDDNDSMTETEIEKFKVQYKNDEPGNESA
ncbi:MAG: hypothetical protein IPO83_02220 [Chitinophagaceae bacterium]|nr:hypothetical protein [Chitinophagaceae bacterium]